MLVADIKTLPAIGERLIMENSVHGEVEDLKVVGHLIDDELPNTVHVFFASDDPADNVHVENGIAFYSIRTYMPMPEGV